MVVLSKSWLSAMGRRLGGGGGTRASEVSTNPRHQTLGILSFEAARTMSKLVSLHRALTEPEISKLRSATMRSYGVQHLNSPDQVFLLRLACAEMLEELDAAAAAISRLASRCHGNRAWPKGFAHVYADLKSGSADFDRRLGFQAKEVERKMRKMEKYLGEMAALHAEMETLAEMEASERKLERWKSYSGPLTAGGGAPGASAQQQNPPGAELFLKKLAMQRRAVKKMQEESLWGKGVEKVADLMARAALTVFARISSVFAAAVPELPRVDSDRNGRFRVGPNHLQFRVYPEFRSGPLERPIGREVFTMNSGPLFRSEPKTTATDSKPWTSRALTAPPSTVGGSGLALRYADVVAAAERMLYSPEMVGKEARNELYQMLPGELRGAVMARLRDEGKGVMEDDWAGEAAASGRERARKVLSWLGPMADDTIRWHTEKSCERQRLEVRPRVLVLQTLCLADRRKAEAAIVEVLVGLSRVLRYLRGRDSGTGSVSGKEGWD